jgi:drug/metabolite transporter (DMT)-like permease
MLTAAFLFALMGVFVKLLSQYMSSIEIVFFRNLVGALFIASSLIKRPSRDKGGRPFLLIFRGVVGSLALYALFYNMSTIGLGEAITYLQTAPIFIALFSFIWLKERLSHLGWIAIFIGFSGILFIFRPGLTMDLKTNFIGLFNGVATALAYTAIRELKKYYDTRAIVLSFMIAGIVLPLISMAVGEVHGINGLDFLFSGFVWPGGMAWVWIISLGIVAMLGQVLMTMAYGEEKAGVISTIGYSNIVFAVFLGSLMGDPLPDIFEVVGMSLIILSGVIISMRRNI